MPNPHVPAESTEALRSALASLQEAGLLPAAADLDALRQALTDRGVSHQDDRAPTARSRLLDQVAAMSQYAQEMHAGSMHAFSGGDQAGAELFVYARDASAHALHRLVQAYDPDGDLSGSYPADTDPLYTVLERAVEGGHLPAQTDLAELTAYLHAAHVRHIHFRDGGTSDVPAHEQMQLYLRLLDSAGEFMAWPGTTQGRVAVIEASMTSRPGEPAARGVVVLALGKPAGKIREVARAQLGGDP